MDALSTADVQYLIGKIAERNEQTGKLHKSMLDYLANKIAGNLAGIFR